MPKIKAPTAGGKDPPLSNRQLEREDIVDDLVVDNHIEDEEAMVSNVCVKMKLNKFSINPQLNGKLRSVVLNMNQLLGEGYAFANFHIIRTLTENKACPKIDKNFYYRCLVAVSENKSFEGTLGDELTRSKTAFDALREPKAEKVNVIGEVQVLADLAISMATMATNHLWMNIEKRLQRFLTWSEPTMKPPMRKRIISALIYKPKASLDKLFPNQDAKEIEGLAVATRLKAILCLPSAGKFASRAHMLLPLYFYILRLTELTKKERDDAGLKFSGRTFTLLPLKNGYTINHIQFSAMALLGYLRGVKLENFKWDGRNEDASAILKKYFNVNAVETKDRKFANRIITDGVSVSVLLNKKCSLVCPNNCPCEATQKKLYLDSLLDRSDKEHARIVSVDPGYTDIATTADQYGNIASYSSAKYYEKALYNLSRRRTNKWNEDTVDLTRAIPKPETHSLTEFKEFVRVYLKNLPLILKHRSEKGYRNMRFLRFRKKQEAIEDICNTIAPKGEVNVVGYGDWKGGNNSPIKRRCSGPQEEIKLHLSKRKDTYLMSIHEFRSSIICHNCHNKLCNMRAKSIIYEKSVKVERDVQKIHKILHCRSRQAGSSSDKKTPSCGTTWNRDVNAAKNILMLTMFQMQGLARPLIFTNSVQLK